MSESDADRIAAVLDEVKRLRESVPEHPQVFRSLDPDPALMTMSWLVEQSTRTAAMREWAGETLSRSRRQMALAEAVMVGVEHDVSVEMDQASADQAQNLIARGYAWREREAKANLSVLERRVEVRGVELRLRQVKMLVAEIEECYRAWRDTEWALDRQVRMMQLRHALGEV